VSHQLDNPEQAHPEYVNPSALAEPHPFDPALLSGLTSPRHGELVAMNPPPVGRVKVVTDWGTMVPSRDLPVYEEVVPAEDLQHAARKHPAPAPAKVNQPARIQPPRLPDVTDSETLTAIMGSVKREGVWVPAKHTTVNVVMGDAKLDFTTAAALPDEVTVRVQVLMGDCTVKVPANAEVIMRGTPIMADLKEVTKHRKRRKLRRLLGDQSVADELVAANARASTMRLVVTGVVIMGDVKVERVLDS
jgi:hypothetical protein